jgi:spermidine synthase
MDLWYTRTDSAGTRWCIRVQRSICSAEGISGRIEAFETEDFGLALAVEGTIVLTEADGFAHREMMVHPPLVVHPAARSVLVVGGGDGALVTEILRHPRVAKIAVTDDDEAYAEAARRCFPSLAKSLGDSRVTVSNDRGDSFVRETRDRFDLILVSARALHGEGAAEQSFFCDCFRALSGDGILVAQLGCALFPERQRELVSAAGLLKRLFPVFRPYTYSAPSSGSASCALAFASKKHDPLRDFAPERWERLGAATRYYNADMHRAAFALPNCVAEALRGA